MTDKELLTLAAKAAGYKREIHPLDPEPHRPAYWIGWNPLTSDVDALRLAVKLGMMLDYVTKGYMSGHIVAVSDGGTCYEPREPDPYAATRRAIVRAAAEIGRAM